MPKWTGEHQRGVRKDLTHQRSFGFPCDYLGKEIYFFLLRLASSYRGCVFRNPIPFHAPDSQVSMSGDGGRMRNCWGSLFRKDEYLPTKICSDISL